MEIEEGGFQRLHEGWIEKCQYLGTEAKMVLVSSL